MGLKNIYLAIPCFGIHVLMIIDTYTQISDVIHIPKIHHINMNIYSPIVDMKWTIYYSIKRLQNNDRKLNYSAYY